MDNDIEYFKWMDNDNPINGWINGLMNIDNPIFIVIIDDNGKLFFVGTGVAGGLRSWSKAAGSNWSTSTLIDGSVNSNSVASTLNCPEEVELAERLIDINPWSDMVRLARTGGEINAVSIRIARAATGRDKVALCGYHGWHDWYLSTNLNSKEALSDLLLPGLEPKGVPKALEGTTIPFVYNDIQSLKKIFYENKLYMFFC